MSTALLDRLTHHCRIVEAGNESHRSLHGSTVAKKRIEAREQARRNDNPPPPEGETSAIKSQSQESVTIDSFRAHQHAAPKSAK